MSTNSIFLFKRVGHWHLSVLTLSLAGRWWEAVEQHISSTTAFEEETLICELLSQPKGNKIETLLRTGLTEPLGPGNSRYFVSEDGCSEVCKSPGDIKHLP